MKDFDILRQRLAQQPRASLSFLPTPLHRLDKMSDILGIDLYIKRDDFTGRNLFGGNKTRKLEYLIGKALEDDCEYVFTYGATQSNHAMQTVWTSVCRGLKPVIYLAAVVEPDENDPKANLLLDKLFGAEIHIVRPLEGEDFLETERRSFEMGREHIKALEADGHRCMDIPMGGANGRGSLGYVEAMAEIYAWSEQAGLDFDFLYHSTGSGGTMAGLAAGKKLLGMDVAIRSIAAMKLGPSYRRAAARIGEEALGILGYEGYALSEADFEVDENHYHPGYEQPSRGASEAIKMLAAQEGILVDPVYSGKALCGLISDARSGRIPAGSKVLFLHTGGATVFFAEREILGELI